MAKHIVSILCIYACSVIAWNILAVSTESRTHSADYQMREKIGQLWGVPQRQEEPSLLIITNEAKTSTKTILENDEKKIVEETIPNFVSHEVGLNSSDINVGLKLKHRRKGLLWYSTYRVSFDADYSIVNNLPKSERVEFTYAFPSSECIYDNFIVTVDGKEVDNIVPVKGAVTILIDSVQGDKHDVHISYSSQGLNSWWYAFNGNVSQIKNFNMTMTTDFFLIDFPENGISPVEKQRTDKGYVLKWNYKSLISGISIGLVMPEKLNPGPFVTQISFFAPVSLFIFLFLMFIITVVKRIRIHPMNYFFICASFFSFHLLMAYLVDHIDVHLAFFICSVVSIGLVVSYMRLVVGPRFAIVETGLSQLVFLVFFSYTFFFKGYSGLIITILCILTLFIVMQITGRMDWNEATSMWGEFKTKKKAFNVPVYVDASENESTVEQAPPPFDEE